MAAVVGNLYRRLAEFARRKLHPVIKAHLQDIQRSLRFLQPFLTDAEWKRELHEAARRIGRQVYCGEEEGKRYCKISHWLSRVAALATEVEDIIVSYDLHLCKMNATSLYNKLRYFHFFLSSFDSVYAKIRRFLSRGQPITAAIPNGAHSNDARKFSLDDDRVPLLSYPTSSYTASITSWPNDFLGMEMLELLQHFSNKVIQEIYSLNSDAIYMHIVSQVIGDFASRYDSGKAIQTILESVNLIGRQTEEKQLEDWLLAEVKEECNPPVVTGVTGVPGIGKTTLVAAIYDRVKRNFDCHAWIFVSPDSNPTNFLRNVLRGILKSMSAMVPNHTDSLDEETLKEVIHRLLMGRKLLLVLDDIPIQDKEVVVLDYVKLLALPKDCKAKIICTSRKSSADYNHVLDLQRLTPQNAFNLLRKRACLGLEGTRFWPSVQSEIVGILNICDGLPLAITTVGGMLSTKQMKSQEWNKVYQKLMEAQNVPLSFMSLSYADLSPVLKSCFLYAASFPPQYEISCKRLQRLWIAEGFIQNAANMTLEDIARLQLDELIQRNMIQVVRVGTDGAIETCRVLGPVREYALTRYQQDQYFCTILDSTADNAFIERPHRLFLHAESSSIIGLLDHDGKLNFSKLKSFLAISKLNIDQPLFVKFKLLSVLEIQELSGDTLPNAIGDLVLLRYMSLRGTKLKKIPSSLKKLQRLETLDIRDTFVRDLPAGLESLAMLRHLLLAGSYSDATVNLMLEVNLLKNLQTLTGLKLTEDIAKGLQHLPQIQKLSAGEVKSIDSANLFESIDHLKFLRSLTIKCAREQEKINMISCKPHYNLEKIRFGGPVHNLLHWISRLHALKYLYLWDNVLTDDPFSSLEHLPNLVLLSLCNAYDGENIQFGEKGFLKLKKLSILHCRNLKQWLEIKDGAMGNLQMLTIAYCPKLSSPPKGLKNLTSLQALQLSKMPAQFINQARYIHLSSKFSLQVRDTTQPSAVKKANKRIPVFKPPHRILKMDSSSSRPNFQKQKTT